MGFVEYQQIVPQIPAHPLHPERCTNLGSRRRCALVEVLE
jgi:hypothetical protein